MKRYRKLCFGTLLDNHTFDGDML